MKLKIVPLAASNAPEALHLVKNAYDSERTVSPLLPPRMLGDSGKVLSLIRESIGNGCLAAFRDGRMVGFMGVFVEFPFKGQRAALIREFSHAAAGSDRILVYQLLYATLGEILRQRQTQLHIAAHFAGDLMLRDALYQLGFGAIATERLRGLSRIEGAASTEIVREHDFLAVADIDAEHRRYYRSAPIFVRKDDSPAAVRSRLLQHQKRGDALFVYREGGFSKAYFMVGPCMGQQEGFLLRNSNTAQILSAYVEPGTRGRGVGKILLNACVEWASGQGFSRMFVEHETANVSGGGFWERHFSPYLRFSMRYVEDCA
jgi:GNAT superfamily N-acetyltransferase